MTITHPTSGVTFGHAAAMLAEHLADHALPEPASLTVTTSYGHLTVTAQLRGITFPGVAADLIAWADTLSVVTVEAWRPSERDRVHLSILGTLTGSTSAVELKAYGSVDFDPVRFADLQPHKCQGVSVALEQLRNWAATDSTTTGAPVLEVHRVGR
ncbi:MAG: hypothetical protein ACREQ5_34500 [Candidatus Dormibacteria bacterium]